ncbi:hypothetical protein GPECTOR_9g653 [Gonium pectorale]|uniref:MPN domain-containing protein n=1 Tax=Gonium pectorale TaxID=33097 RepID=A0A150GSE2_GONPE|nr:hypothetical protein GPECTOR_9g653 [Gonium pectorale]|eukprot:KXZ52608.1 hypothetical protein GPECTOR_9g653 [Gonium pectorale]
MASSVLLPGVSNLSVKVHPVVLLSICDAYIRRKEHQDRVIGTLLGVVVDNVIEVKNCYVVPHNESSDQVLVDLNHHKTMFDMLQKVAPHEVIVGWFATGADLYNSDPLIQEFYNKESTHPVHLVVDTTLKDNKFSIKAYLSRPLAFGDKQLATEFVQLPCDTIVSDIERVGAELMLTGLNDPSPESKRETANKSFSDEGETLQGSMARLADLVARASDYVQNVVDAMMVTYLSDLLRAHVALAERLGTAALPIM